MSTPDETVKKIEQLAQLSSEVFNSLKDGAVSAELLNGQINKMIRNKDMLAKELEEANKSIEEAKLQADKILKDAKIEGDKILEIVRENLNAAIIDRESARKELERAKIQSQVDSTVKI